MSKFDSKVDDSGSKDGTVTSLIRSGRDENSEQMQTRCRTDADPMQTELRTTVEIGTIPAIDIPVKLTGKQ